MYIQKYIDGSVNLELWHQLFYVPGSSVPIIYGWQHFSKLV